MDINEYQWLKCHVGICGNPTYLICGKAIPETLTNRDSHAGLIQFHMSIMLEFFTTIGQQPWQFLIACMSYWPSKRPSSVTRPKFQQRPKLDFHLDLHFWIFQPTSIDLYTQHVSYILIRCRNIQQKIGYHRIGRNNICKVKNRVVVCDSSWGSLFDHPIIQPTILVNCRCIAIPGHCMNPASNIFSSHSAYQA